MGAFTHKAQPSSTVLGNHLNAWWQVFIFSPPYPPTTTLHNIHQSIPDKLGLLPLPSSSTSRTSYFWNQCFLLFSTSVCTCDEVNHGGGGGRAAAAYRGNLKGWHANLWSFKLQFRWFVKHCFRDVLELKGLHLLAFWHTAGLVIALSKYCGGRKSPRHCDFYFFLFLLVHYACIWSCLS